MNTRSQKTYADLGESNSYFGTLDILLAFGPSPLVSTLNVLNNFLPQSISLLPHNLPEEEAPPEHTHEELKPLIHGDNGRTTFFPGASGIFNKAYEQDFREKPFIYTGKTWQANPEEKNDPTYYIIAAQDDPNIRQYLTEEEFSLFRVSQALTTDDSLQQTPTPSPR